MSLLTADELAAIASLPKEGIIPPKIWEEPWEFGCGVDDFKLPPPHPDLGAYERDFPWAPRVSKMTLRSGKSRFCLFTGSYQQKTTDESNCGCDTKRVRLHGTQHYTNGDKFDGEFKSYNGTPSKGTYTFANGDTLTGHFTDESYGGVHPNTISMGTFYNKTLGISYTGRWVHSTTGEANLMGYILVNFHPRSEISDPSQCQVFYYRNSPSSTTCGYYENFNMWLTDHTSGYGVPDNFVPFPIDHTLHPDSSEGRWLDKFDARLKKVWDAKMPPDSPIPRSS